MDDLAFLRERIAAYADYHDQDARHLVDQQIRAWVGKALSRLRETLAPVGPLGERLDAVIFHCEFGDQRVIRASDDAEFSDDTVLESIRALDRRLVESAEHARSVTAEKLADFLSEIESLFEQRFCAIASAPA